MSTLLEVFTAGPGPRFSVKGVYGTIRYDDCVQILMNVRREAIPVLLYSPAEILLEVIIVLQQEPVKGDTDLTL